MPRRRWQPWRMRPSRSFHLSPGLLRPGTSARRDGRARREDVGQSELAHRFGGPRRGSPGGAIRVARKPVVGVIRDHHVDTLAPQFASRAGQCRPCPFRARTPRAPGAFSRRRASLPNLREQIDFSPARTVRSPDFFTLTTRSHATGSRPPQPSSPARPPCPAFGRRPSKSCAHGDAPRTSRDRRQAGGDTGPR